MNVESDVELETDVECVVWMDVYECMWNWKRGPESDVDGWI